MFVRKSGENRISSQCKRQERSSFVIDGSGQAALIADWFSANEPPCRSASAKRGGLSFHLAASPAAQTEWIKSRHASYLKPFPRRPEGGSNLHFRRRVMKRKLWRAIEIVFFFEF